MPATVGHFHASTHPEVAVAASVVQLAEDAAGVVVFALSVVRSGGRARVVSLGREWTLPRTELIR